MVEPISRTWCDDTVPSAVMQSHVLTCMRGSVRCPSLRPRSPRSGFGRPSFIDVCTSIAKKYAGIAAFCAHCLNIMRHLYVMRNDLKMERGPGRYC